MSAPPPAKKGGKKGKKSAAAAEREEAPRQPPPPFKPAKYTHYDRQVVDYVRTATAKNVWYYRCADSERRARHCVPGAAAGGAATARVRPAASCCMHAGAAVCT